MGALWCSSVQPLDGRFGEVLSVRDCEGGVGCDGKMTIDNEAITVTVHGLDRVLSAMYPLSISQFPFFRVLYPWSG
jgi:hypothetical protein